MLSIHEQKVSDGWVLYYNEDGYPYYYNESTGESEWAEYEEYVEEQHNDYKEVGDDYDQDDEEGSEAEDGDDDDDDGDNSEDESGSESDEESKAQREQRIFDKVMEQKFLEYLKTPEGMAAAQAELERVGRKVDKRLAKKSSLVEQEYVRSLRSKKKEKNVPSNTIFGKIMETTNAWMFPPAEDKSISSKSSGKSSGKHKKGTNAKVDDYNRETKQRHANSSSDGPNLSAVEAGTANRGRQPTRGSPSSSRSSSLSSDTGSFSSEDSDVAEIDAPLFSEVPASWFSAATLRVLFAAFQTPTVVATDDSGTAATSNASVAPPNATSTALVTTSGGSAQPFLPESCVVVAEQSFTVLGGAFVQGFGFLFERLNPVLEGFVNSLLDAQASGPPNSRQAQRRQIAAAVSAAGSTTGNTTDQRDYSNLPPAPPSRVPLSARGPPTSTPRGGARPSPRTGGATGPAHSLPTAPPPSSRSQQSTPRVPSSTPRSHVRENLESPRSALPPVPPQREVRAPPAPPVSESVPNDVQLHEAESTMEEVSLSETSAEAAEMPTNKISTLEDDTQLLVDVRAERVEPPLEPLPSPSSAESHHEHGHETQYATDMPPVEEFSEDPSSAADHLLVLALHSQDEEQEQGHQDDGEPLPLPRSDELEAAPQNEQQVTSAEKLQVDEAVLEETKAHEFPEDLLSAGAQDAAAEEESGAEQVSPSSVVESGDQLGEESQSPYTAHALALDNAGTDAAEDLQELNIDDEDAQIPTATNDEPSEEEEIIR